MDRAVVFDIDGVLADFEGQVDRELHRVFGRLADTNRSLYRFEDRYEGNLAILSYAQELTQNPNFYYGLPVIEGAIELVNTLSNMGYFPWFITSRPSLAKGFTKRWLIKHLGTDVFALACGISDKAKYIESIAETFEFIVEDSPGQKEELEAIGCNVLIWSQPWNERLFPRLYVRGDGTIMLWEDESEEADSFLEKVEEQ